MNADFNLTSSFEKSNLMIKTDGYINNEGGEKLLNELEKLGIVMKEEWGLPESEKLG